MTDPTTVNITIRKNDAHLFLFRLGTPPHEIYERPGGLVQLAFHGWDRPACHEFQCDGIPFTGFHGEGVEFEPHRMCGDGELSMEIYCDRGRRLYVFLDDATGLPDPHSSKAVAEFLDLERSARRLLSSPPADAAA